MSDCDTLQASAEAIGFTLLRCAAGHWEAYPRSACKVCGAPLARERASGCGVVYSLTIVYRAPSPAFAQEVPYAIAIVATDEGPRLMGRLEPWDSSAIGTAVVAVAPMHPHHGYLAFAPTDCRP